MRFALVSSPSPTCPDLSRAVPYVGPLYSRHGREVAPASWQPVGGPVRPCC